MYYFGYCLDMTHAYRYVPCVHPREQVLVNDVCFSTHNIHTRAETQTLPASDHRDTQHTRDKYADPLMVHDVCLSTHTIFARDK